MRGLYFSVSRGYNYFVVEKNGESKMVYKPEILNLIAAYEKRIVKLKDPEAIKDAEYKKKLLEDCLKVAS